MNQYEEATKQVIEWLQLTAEMTHKTIKSKIKNAFTERYSTQVSKGVLKMHIDDFTESVCLMLNIPEQ